MFIGIALHPCLSRVCGGRVGTPGCRDSYVIMGYDCARQPHKSQISTPYDTEDKSCTCSWTLPSYNQSCVFHQEEHRRRLETDTEAFFKVHNTTKRRRGTWADISDPSPPEGKEIRSVSSETNNDEFDLLTESFPSATLPECSQVEIMNQFVTTVHEKELLLADVSGDVNLLGSWIFWSKRNRDAEYGAHLSTRAIEEQRRSVERWIWCAYGNVFQS